MILCFACQISSNKVMGEQIFVCSGCRVTYLVFYVISPK